MSAQVVTALRVRAQALRGDADRLAAVHERSGGMAGESYQQDAERKRWLADEFDQLADVAEHL